MEEMKLTGSAITKIKGERKRDFSGKIAITSNIKVKSVEEVKGVKDTLQVEYLLEIGYGELGNIEVGGILIIAATPKTIEAIKNSQKDKNFETPENIALSNLILQQASIKAFGLESELGLPLHIKIPSLEVKKDKK